MSMLSPDYRPLGQARFREPIEKTLGRVLRPNKRAPNPRAQRTRYGIKYGVPKTPPKLRFCRVQLNRTYRKKRKEGSE